MLFQEFTTTDLSAVPGVTDTPMMLRVCAFEKDCAISVGLNADGENADGENADGLNADGEKADGLKADGLNADGLNADGLNADGLNADGANSAVSLSRLAVLAVAGLNWFRNAWPMSLNTATS